MKTNLELACECGADLMPNADAKRTLAVFDAVDLDAFAKRIRISERERCALAASAMTSRKRQVYAGANNLPIAPCEIAEAIRKGAQ